MLPKIAIIGFPCALGGRGPGPERGPESIRSAGLIRRIKNLGFLVNDLGDIPVQNIDGYEWSENAKNLGRIIKYDKALAEKVYESIRAGMFPLVLGGDHSLTIGSLAGVSRAYKDTIGVVYFDAHADFNTPGTTPSGNVHGMPLALAAGLYASEETASLVSIKTGNISLVGVREIDTEARILVKENGVRIFNPQEIKTSGVHEMVKRCLDISSEGTGSVHLSVDTDVIDPKYAKGTNTPSPDGLTPEEVKAAVYELAMSGKIRSMDFAEVNPLRDGPGESTPALAVEVIASFLEGLRSSN